MNHFYEKLIRVVKDYKVIYDSNHKNYSDFQKKHETWNEIGAKLKTSGKECKRYWSLLRDSYRRWVKKNPTNPEKKWRYSDEMAFLLPYIKEKPNRFIVHEIEDSFQEANERVHSPAASEHTTAEPPEKKHKKEAPSSAELIKYILESQKTPPLDDIEKFFAGITSTVRSFPSKERAIAKAKIFEVVSKMELEILSRPSTSEPPAIMARSLGALEHTTTSNRENEGWDDVLAMSTNIIKTEIEYE